MKHLTTTTATHSIINPATQIASNKRISANAVRELCGDVSDMTLWRWLENPAMNFPKPIYIARRRYWKEQDVVAWLEAHASNVAA